MIAAVSGKNLLERLDESKALHYVADSLGGRALVNRVLHRLPVPRTAPDGARYRVRYLDTLPLANEIFVQKIYDESIDPGLRTFVDLGSNVGLFLARLAERTGRVGERASQIRGLAIDADPAMVDETRWTISANRLDGVVPVHGLAASPSAGPEHEEDFYLNSCRMLSSRFTVDEPGQTVKADWTRVRVASVDVERIFRDRVGDVPCDLLKVDIEGSERDWFVKENTFLQRVRRVVIECHRWILPLEELLARMNELGFGPPRYVRQTDALAVIIADRESRPAW
jgi:FkbM family methyltransferase